MHLISGIAQQLIFFSLLDLFLPVFGAPTAPRAFELLTHFKQSQFGTDLRQCSCISDSAAPSLSFSIPPFLQSIFPLSWMGRCWLAKTNHMTIQPRYVGLKMDPNCPSVKRCQHNLCHLITRFKTALYRFLIILRLHIILNRGQWGFGKITDNTQVFIERSDNHTPSWQETEWSVANQRSWSTFSGPRTACPNTNSEGLKPRDSCTMVRVANRRRGIPSSKSFPWAMQ